jgi:hypothetical protein
MSPTRPMIVRVTPRLTNASPPTDSTRAITPSTSSAEASGFMTTTTLRSVVPRQIEVRAVSHPETG